MRPERRVRDTYEHMWCICAEVESGSVDSWAWECPEPGRGRGLRSGSRGSGGGEALGLFPVGGLVAKALDVVEVTGNRGLTQRLAGAVLGSGGDQCDRDGG